MRQAGTYRKRTTHEMCALASYSVIAGWSLHLTASLSFGYWNLWHVTYFITIFTIAHKITHRMIGPFDRIVRELDECVKDRRHGPIRLRKHDKFEPLVEQINILLDKLKDSTTEPFI